MGFCSCGGGPQKTGLSMVSGRYHGGDVWARDEEGVGRVGVGDEWRRWSRRRGDPLALIARLARQKGHHSVRAVFTPPCKVGAPVRDHRRDGLGARHDIQGHMSRVRARIGRWTSTREPAMSESGLCLQNPCQQRCSAQWCFVWFRLERGPEGGRWRYSALQGEGGRPWPRSRCQSAEVPAFGSRLMARWLSR